MLLMGCPWCEADVELEGSLDGGDLVCPTCLTRVRWVDDEALSRDRALRPGAIGEAAVARAA
jgi:hypothetical protein